MIKTSLVQDVDSCFSRLIMCARRHDIAAIVRESSFYRVLYAAKLTLDEVTELKQYDTVIILIHGKVTKSTLTPAQRDQLLVYIRESNANLN